MVLGFSEGEAVMDEIADEAAELAELSEGASPVLCEQPTATEAMTPTATGNAVTCRFLMRIYFSPLVCDRSSAKNAYCTPADRAPARDIYEPTSDVRRC